MFINLILGVAMAFADGLPHPGDPNDPVKPVPGIQFDFAQQGMYSVKLNCTPRPEDCNSAIIQQLNRLSIVDSHSMFGVWIMLGSTNPSDVIQSFYGSQVGPSGTELTAAPRTGGRSGKFSYINIKIDPQSGEINGTLSDYQYPGQLVIHGKPLARIADLLNLHPPIGLPVDALLGRYRGAVAGIPGTLLIAKTPAGKLYGFFSSDSTEFGSSTFTVTFESGVWNSATETLELIFQNPRFSGEGQLSLVVKTGAPNMTLKSIYFNAFVHDTSEFTKI
ncbi:MAG: hypothetical protein ACXVA9_09945 [Bdellovibrionales bacterium]